MIYTKEPEYPWDWPGAYKSGRVGFLTQEGMGLGARPSSPAKVKYSLSDIAVDPGLGFKVCWGRERNTRLC